MGICYSYCLNDYVCICSYTTNLIMLIRELTEAPKGSSKYGLEGKPEWYDRAVKMKLNNPRISATEIARQVGASKSTVLYWLAGSKRVSGHGQTMLDRSSDSFPFKPEDFPTSPQTYVDGAKPEWYDQALQMAKAGEPFTAIAKKFGVSPHNIGKWLVKGRRYSTTGKLVNPDAELEPRRVAGQKLDVNLINSLITDYDLTDEEIIDLIKDDKGPQIASQVKNMLPTLRKKLNPATQVIDKTRTGSMRDPDITGFVK